MAIISKYKAVVDLPKGFFNGFFAWFGLVVRSHYTAGWFSKQNETCIQLVLEFCHQ